MKPIIACVLAVVIGVFGYSYLRKAQLRNAGRAQVELATSNLEARRPVIATLSKHLKQLEALVQREGWASGTVKPIPETTAPTLTIWAEELRNDTPQLFDYLFSHLSNLRDLVEWASNESFPNFDLAIDGEALDLKMQPVLQGPVTILEVRNLVEPEISKLNFEGSGSAGEFIPGSLSFTFAVVAPASSKLLATGSGKVVSSESIAVRGTANMLMADLRRQAEAKAANLVEELLK